MFALLARGDETVCALVAADVLATVGPGFEGLLVPNCVDVFGGRISWLRILYFFV